MSPGIVLKAVAQIDRPIPESFQCPSCWEEDIPLEEILWFDEAFIPGGEDSDDFLNEKAKRFLPDHFSPGSEDDAPKALDKNRKECSGLACPECHLEIPLSYLESSPFSTSIVGGSGVGKSFYHTALIWWLRRQLPFFGWYGEPAIYKEIKEIRKNNKALEKLSDNLFDPSDNQDPIAISATSTKDNSITINKNKKKPDAPEKPDESDAPEKSNGSDNGDIRLMMPFIYKLTSQSKKVLSLCLYDHAGEHFREEQADRKVEKQIQHLKSGDAYMFMYDPTTIFKFAKAMSGNMYRKVVDDEKPTNLFQTMVDKITGGSTGTKFNRHLIVVVTKYDEWMDLELGETNEDREVRAKLQIIQENLQNDPYIDHPTIQIRVQGKNKKLQTLSRRIIDKVSDAVRDILAIYDPKFVHGVENFADKNVVYIPISATGCNADWKDDGGGLKVVPGTLNPIWVGVPLLYALATQTSYAEEIILIPPKPREGQ